MALALLLAIIYTITCRKALQEVNDRFQLAMEMAAACQKVQDAPNSHTAELRRRMDIECEKNRDAIEALRREVQSKTDKDCQTNQSAVGALTSELEATNLGLKAEVATAQADITSSKEWKETLVKDVPSVQGKRSEDKRTVGELLKVFELRFLQLEDRVGKAEANSVKKDGELQLATQRIEQLERTLKDAFQENNGQKTKFVEQNIINEAQQKGLDALQEQLDKSRNEMVVNEDRLLAVEDLAAKTTRSLKPLKDALTEDLANIIWASAQQTADINDFTTNLAGLSKVVVEDIRPTIGNVKKGLKSLWVAIRDNIGPTLGGVKKSIEDLQRDNRERDLKLDPVQELVNSLTKTVQNDRESLSRIKDDLQTSINTVAEDVQSAQDFFTNRLELTDKELERLEEDVDDAKKQIGFAKTDIETLQKEPVLTAKVESLTSPIQKSLSTAENDFTSLKVVVSTQGKKQAQTEKRLQEQGNKIEGHSRQLNGIQLALKSLDEVGVAAVPIDRTRSARQQRRKAAKKAEEQGSEGNYSAFSAHAELSVDVPGSRYTPDFESSGSSELDDGRIAPKLFSPTKISDEFKASSSVTDSKHSNSSTSARGSGEDIHEKSSASSPDPSSPQGDSDTELAQAKESDETEESTILEKDGEDGGKKIMYKSGGKKTKEATERAQAKLTIITSSSSTSESCDLASDQSGGQSAIPDPSNDLASESHPSQGDEQSAEPDSSNDLESKSHPAQEHEQSATPSTPSDASPKSYSNGCPDQCTTSSQESGARSTSDPDVTTEWSPIVSQWSQPELIFLPHLPPTLHQSRTRTWVPRNLQHQVMETTCHLDPLRT